MSEIFDVIGREALYLLYYFEIQLRQIFGYWILGMLIGSAVSVFLKDIIHNTFRSLGEKKLGIFCSFIASALCVASPLCMYGTIPIAASFSKSGIKDDWLAAFMMSSILLNPQLIVYSTALGTKLVVIRIVSCFLCGSAAGLLVRLFYKDKEFFSFTAFKEPKNRDTTPNIFLRFGENLLRNLKATGLWFFIGVVLSAVFQRYVPEDVVTNIFGGNEAWGVLMAATLGVPLYACGGGTIPLLQAWLSDGMSVGSAAAFMLTGPATKITNLGAVKIVLGVKRFLLYLAFNMVFALITGLVVR